MFSNILKDGIKNGEFAGTLDPDEFAFKNVYSDRGGHGCLPCAEQR